jgi:putative transposase
VAQLYHVWFSTKGRQDVLRGEVRDEVKRLLRKIARTKGIGLVEVEALGDHAHLLVCIEKPWNLSSAMHQLKGASARSLLERRDELRLELDTQSLWQKGYGWRGVHPDQKHQVRNYIRTQDHRHPDAASNDVRS